MEITPQVLNDDRQLVLNIVQNERQVVDPAAPERRAAVVEMLERGQRAGRRRGDPTRHDLMDLSDLVPGEAETTQNAARPELLADLLRRLHEVRPEGPRAQQEERQEDEAEHDLN